MMHVAIAVNDRDKTLISTAISILTWSKSYHCELIFTNGDVCSVDPTNGVHWTTRVYDRYHWILLPLPWINHKDEKIIRKWCEDKVESNAQYDYLRALFGNFCPVDDPLKWYCAELVVEAISPFLPEVFSVDKWYSPNDIWKILADKLNDEYPKSNEQWKFRRIS